MEDFLIGNYATTKSIYNNINGRNSTKYLELYKEYCSIANILPKQWICNAIMSIPSGKSYISLILEQPALLYKNEKLTSNEAICVIRALLDPFENKKDIIFLKELRVIGDAACCELLEEFMHCLMAQKEYLNLYNLTFIDGNLIFDYKDGLSLLNSCIKLKKTLKHFILTNSKIKIKDKFTWYDFFNTVNIEYLCFQDTSLTNEELRLLCNIIHKSNTLKSSLEVLRLGPPCHQDLNDDTYEKDVFDEITFVELERCISKLDNLKFIDIKGLNYNQIEKLQLSWNTFRGPENADILHELKYYHIKTPNIENYSKIIHKEFKSPIEIHSNVELKKENKHIVNPSMPKIKNQTKEMHKLSNQKLKHSILNFTTYDTRVDTNAHTQQQEEEEEEPNNDTQKYISSLEMLEHNFKLPRKLNLREYYFGNTIKTKPKLKTNLNNKKTNISTRTRQSHIERHFKKLMDKTTEPKRPETISLLSSTETEDDEILNSLHKYDEKEDYDYNDDFEDRMDNGRIFKIQNNDDMYGYASDGFARPDNELVYTTSASDDEVKRDMENLKHGRILLSKELESEKMKELRLEYHSEDEFNSNHKSIDNEDYIINNIELDTSTSTTTSEKKKKSCFSIDSQIQESYKTPDLTIDDEILNVDSLLDIPSTSKHNSNTSNKSFLNSEMSNHKEKIRPKDDDLDLTKELIELTPFYYDKRKEIHKPGEYFEVDTTNEKQCVLRSGKAIPYTDDSDNGNIIQKESSNIEDLTSGKKENYNINSNKELIIKSKEENESLNLDNLNDDLNLDLDDEESNILVLDEVQEVKNDSNENFQSHSKVARELKRLKFWSWDSNIKKHPPNEDKYYAKPNEKKRRLTN